MLGRKQEINLQLQQIVDGLLLLFTFWGSFAFRYYGTEWFGWDRSIGPFTDFHWMIPVIIPFGLIWAQFEHVNLRKVAAESGHASEELAEKDTAAQSVEWDG